MLQIVQRLPRTASPRRRRAYAIDALAERYKTAIRQIREGADCSAVFHGIGQVSPNALSPIAIAVADGITSGSYYCADLGVNIATGGVSPWEDMWGANDVSQAVSTSFRPQQVTESTLNRRASITGDGADDRLAGGPEPPLPGTTPYTMRLVARCNTWVSGGRLLGGAIRGGTTSQTIVAFNTGAFVTSELTMTDGVWYRIKLYSSNSAADHFRVGSSVDTTNLQNGDRTALPIFSDASGANIGAFSLANLLYGLGADLSAAADVALERFYFSYYGTNITLG
jgi:hypothetical protein